MKKQALFCIALAGTLMVGGCGQKATDSTAGTAQVTETSDSAPADKPDGVQDKNSDKPGNPPDGAKGSQDGKQDDITAQLCDGFKCMHDRSINHMTDRLSERFR